MPTIAQDKRSMELKIVYCGCARSGKSANLTALKQLMDPQNEHGRVSVDDRNDRTLFFKLLPLDLGQVGGVMVRLKIYTVPGQLHYELTRRQVLADVDGIIVVMDSSPDARKMNAWAIENLRFNLRANHLDPETVPIVIQWNKRDLPDARPIAELESELNRRRMESTAAVATTGRGVLDTISRIVKLALVQNYAKMGRPPLLEEEIRKSVDKALEQARRRAPEESPSEETIEQGFDMDRYREEQASKGRLKQIVDQESLLTEAVSNNMLLVEKLYEYRDVESTNECLLGMIQGLERMGAQSMDPAAPPVPDGWLSDLLNLSKRSQGSVLFFKSTYKTMEERQVVGPYEREPLNVPALGSSGSLAYRFSQTGELRVIEDLQSDTYFEGSVANIGEIAGLMVVPLVCDRLKFGSIFVYCAMSERPFSEAEKSFWKLASHFLGLSLHWRALRKKLSEPYVTCK